MTAFKRCCAWVLTLVMLLALIPGTAFAVSETDSAALTETTVANIANDVAKQVIQGSRDRDGKIQLDSIPWWTTPPPHRRRLPRSAPC